MGLRRLRIDSVAELAGKKTLAELQQENESLKNKVTALENELDSTNLALCDVYEQLLTVASASMTDTDTETDAGTDNQTTPNTEA